MTREEAVTWLVRAPSWSVASAQVSAMIARRHWRGFREPEGALDAASDAAREVAIIAAMWPRAPGDVLGEMRYGV